MNAAPSGNRLTVISYPAVIDPLMETAALRADGNQDHGPLLFGRAQNYGHLEAEISLARPVTTLDLIGHGRAGWFELDERHPITMEDRASWEPLRKVAELLEDDATIRLLGCLTADGAVAQAFLRELAEFVGFPMVGTLAPITTAHFGATGIAESFIEGMTYSTAKAGLTAYHPPGGGPKLLEVPGYVFDSAAPPIARVQAAHVAGSLVVHFVCDNHIVWFSDRERRPQGTYLWRSPEKPPEVETILRALNAA